MNKITCIRLENFTAFAALDQHFSPGVNIIIGTNGTGKTHLLKILYAACAVTIGEDKEKGFAIKLRNVFNPFEDRIGRLTRWQSISVNAKMLVARGGASYSPSFPTTQTSPRW